MAEKKPLTQEQAVNEVVGLMWQSLQQFPPAEQERRIARIEGIMAKPGRRSRGKRRAPARTPASRPSSRLRAKQ